MTNLDFDEDRLSRAMRRLMALQPPLLAPSARRANQWFGAIVAGLATLVIVAGAVGGTIALRDRHTSGSAPAGTSHPTDSPSVSASPSVSPVPILTPAGLPAWMSVCMQSAGITAVTPPTGPRLTTAQVIAFVNAAGDSFGPDPITAYLEFLAPSVDPSAKPFARPVWAVGVDGLHYPMLGLNVPSRLATASPQPYISGNIVFISDPSGKVELGLGCPSG
jgi:hypothetical protein